MMEKFKAFIKSNRWPILSGVMIGTSYIPFPPWALLFCYVPLFLWLEEDVYSRRKAFVGAWVTQFILSLIGFHWIAYTAFEFGGFNWALSLLTLILFAAFIHLHIPIAALISHEIHRRFKLQGIQALFVYALVFALVERAWPMIFPWHMGYTLLYARIPVFQWADVIGFDGLSALVFLLNAWVAHIWQKQDDMQAVFKHAPMLAILVIVLMFGGIWKKKYWRKTDEILHVLAVQPNIGNAEKIYAEHGISYKAKIMFKLNSLTQKGLIDNLDSDLIVWPETAFPDYIDRPEKSKAQIDLLKSALGTYNKPIVMGAFSQDPPGERSFSYNGLALVNAQGEILAGPYRKTNLLAFGEYLPLSETFPSLLKLLPFVANFGRGSGPITLDWKRPSGQVVKIGGQICYDGLFPEFTRGLAKNGADILVNVTNDSWFGVPAEPRQHMIMTLARAIEVRRPMIRSTNTGITTGILASGEVLEKSPTKEEWTGYFPLEYKTNPGLTFYTRFGHLDWVLLLIALAALLGGGKAFGRTQSPGLERGPRTDRRESDERARPPKNS